MFKINTKKKHTTKGNKLVIFGTLPYMQLIPE